MEGGWVGGGGGVEAQKKKTFEFFFFLFQRNTIMMMASTCFYRVYRFFFLDFSWNRCWVLATFTGFFYWVLTGISCT